MIPAAPMPAPPLHPPGSRPGRPRRRLAAASRARSLPGLLALVLAFTCAVPHRPAAASPDLPPLVLNVGFLRFAFSNVNRHDAEAAFKVFVATLARKRGYAAQSTVHVFEDARDFEPAIRAGKLQLAIVDSWRFLAMDIRTVVAPAFVTSHHGETGKRYLVLSRRDAPLTRLADLRGRELVEVDITNASLGHYWLETLLAVDRLGTPASFFSRVETVNKASAAVLPVFFGRKPACVVDETSFDVMKELNPQIGNTLRIVRTSDPLVDGILCLRHDGWASDQQRLDVLRALAELHAEPDGQQLLTLFKTGQLIAYEDAQLDTVRRLRTAYDRVKEGHAP